MTATIRQQLGDPDRASDDLVPAIRRIAFAIDLLVTREVAARANLLQRDQRIERARPGNSRAPTSIRSNPVLKLVLLNCLYIVPSITDGQTMPPPPGGRYWV